MKNGMIVLVGNSIAEVEADLNACKAAMSTGTMRGCGAKTLAEAEKALHALADALGAKVEMPTPKSYGCSNCCHDCVEIEIDDDDDIYDEDEDWEEADLDLEELSDGELLDLIAEATKELANRA